MKGKEENKKKKERKKENDKEKDRMYIPPRKLEFLAFNFGCCER